MWTEPRFVGDSVIEIGETRIRYSNPLVTEIPSADLSVMKTRPMLRAYIDLCRTLRPRRVVEIGIWKGGSTAMLAELGVERIVSVELSDMRIPALDRYIAERGMHDVVHAWYGVDQADRERLTQIVSDEFEAESLDLVIDDASHRYAESLASFEVLFPRLRPGGLYLLEDWHWDHILADGLTTALATSDTRDDIRRQIDEHVRTEGAPGTPMSRLVMELVLARAINGDVADEIVVGPYWVSVRRGPASLDAQSFRLSEHGVDHFQMLAPLR